MGVFTRTAPRQPAPLRARPNVTSITAGAGSRNPLPYTAVRSITGAARVVNLQVKEDVDRMSRGRGGNEWQAEAWEYYDSIGEIKYAYSLVANVLSRIRLYAAKVGDPTQAPDPADEDDPGGAAAIAALSRLDSAFGGQPGLLRDAGLNLQVSGECYLVQTKGNPMLGVPETWDVRSTDEMTVDTSGKITLQTQKTVASQSQKKILNNKTYMARIWRPHPRYSDDSDSSMRGVLDLCAELLLLNRTFRATARSRLNAGMLYLPDGLSVAAQADTELIIEDDDGADLISPLMPPAPGTGDTDEFEDQLLDAMTTPITDEDSAAAVVPLLVRGPAELADKIKLIKFERAFDASLVARADRVLDRIMQGIDVPKDVVTGLANVKYANAIQIDESLYRAHIEPLTLIICDALTQVYLRPAMKTAGISPDDLNQYVIWYDPSEVTTRPNRANDADSCYEKTVISASALRRAHGFTDGDAPNPTELAVRMLVDKGPITPELAESLLTVISPEVMALVRAANQAASPAPLPPDVAQALGGAPEAPAPGGAPPDTAPAAPPPPPPSTATPAPDGATPAATQPTDIIPADQLV